MANPESTPQLAAVSVKIPVFWRNDPETWFAAVEAQFGTSGVTSDLTKYNYVISALDGETLSRIQDTILTPPSNALIPFWAFTLVQVNLRGKGEGHIAVPNHKIVTSAVGLLIALLAGYLIQVYCKRLAAMTIHTFNPFSSSLFIFIIIFTIFICLNVSLGR